MTKEEQKNDGTIDDVEYFDNVLCKKADNVLEAKKAAIKDVVEEFVGKIGFTANVDFTDEENASVALEPYKRIVCISLPIKVAKMDMKSATEKYLGPMLMEITEKIPHITATLNGEPNKIEKGARLALRVLDTFCDEEILSALPADKREKVEECLKEMDEMADDFRKACKQKEDE